MQNIDNGKAMAKQAKVQGKGQGKGKGKGKAKKSKGRTMIMARQGQGNGTNKVWIRQYTVSLFLLFYATNILQR